MSKEIQYLEEIESLQGKIGDLESKQQELQSTVEQGRREVEFLKFQLAETTTQAQTTEEGLKGQVSKLEDKESALRDKVEDLSHQLTQAQRAATDSNMQEHENAELEQEVRSIC